MIAIFAGSMMEPMTYSDVLWEQTVTTYPDIMA